MTKILVAYNGGTHSRRALATAAGLARAMRATVGVVSVVPKMIGRGGFSIAPWDDGQVHRELLEEARSYLRSSGIEPKLIEIIGEPAAAIETVAAEGGYDTVVIGAGPVGFLTRLLTGSVTAHVVEHARATVVIAN